MINLNATAFAQTWSTKYKNMGPRDRLFLEIMTFAFVGTQAEQSDISIEKIKTNWIDVNKVDTKRADT